MCIDLRDHILLYITKANTHHNKIVSHETYVSTFRENDVVKNVEDMDKMQD